MIAMTGASTNRNLFAPVGNDDFLHQQLQPVGDRLREPAEPADAEKVTRFGPMRTCIQPITLRSHSVR